MFCCYEPTVDGLPASGGASVSATSEVLFTVDADRTASTVFPIITTMVSETIPAGRLADDGDMIRARFAGTVINAGVAGSTFAPFLGIDAVFWWGAISVAIPNGSVLLPWSCDIDITRKSALTFRAAGTFMMSDFSSALTGIGSLALANQGGPIASPAAAVACDWSVAQQFIFNTSAGIAGMTWTITTGSIEILEAP